MADRKQMPEIFPVPKRRMLRRMGLISDQEGIMRRYLREREGWQTHIDHCHSCILDWLGTIRPGALLVLGSGWLLDFPVEDALDLTSGLYLADLNHPRQILHKYRHQKSIRFLEADITGGMLDQVYKSREKTNWSHFRPFFAVPPDMAVLSLNILSQLGSLPADYLQEQQEGRTGAREGLLEKIQSDHMSLLSGHPSLLITDHTELVSGSDGKVLRSIPLLSDKLALPGFKEEWVWEFDRQKRYYSDGNTRMLVGAIELNQG